jgi:hypothetical protein
MIAVDAIEVAAAGVVALLLNRETPAILQTCIVNQQVDRTRCYFLVGNSILIES